VSGALQKWLEILAIAQKAEKGHEALVTKMQKGEPQGLLEPCGFLLFFRKPKPCIDVTALGRPIAGNSESRLL
jgi:hypothetical protein